MLPWWARKIIERNQKRKVLGVANLETGSYVYLQIWRGDGLDDVVEALAFFKLDPAIDDVLLLGQINLVYLLSALLDLLIVYFFLGGFWLPMFPRESRLHMSSTAGIFCEAMQ